MTFECRDDRIRVVAVRGLFSLTHAPNIKSRSKNHREQEEDRDQHNETIPKLLQHFEDLRCQTDGEVIGRDEVNLMDRHCEQQGFVRKFLPFRLPTYENMHQ